MTALAADDFPAFFHAVHGHEPFPWQTRLAKQVAETGCWPSLLDLPTGTGKTAAIDIAVFHLASEAGCGPARRAPLRILFVIDRRIVVDAAAERARKIATELQQARTGVLAIVAARLQTFAGREAPPLDVVRLRGGTPQERDWARSPAQPLVAVSTVDQVGSRLLFRGYGVSSRMWPVHAGLVGADALWLLDEVHLSKPLEETLSAICAGHAANGGGVFAERPRLAPFAMVRLSATPAEKSRDAFGMQKKDREHEVLKPRLAARKIVTIEAIDGEPVAAFVSHGLRFAGLAAAPAAMKKPTKAAPIEQSKLARRVAVVVNRVDLARAVHDEIAKRVGDRAEVLLLTGRIRPLDRDRLLKNESFKLLFADARKSEPAKPVILVATQTIEAGADLDFDALVTEIAPLDCLRQRFGRLDRLGTRQRKGFESQAVILHPKGKPSRDNDWAPTIRIYGDSAKATADWLGSSKNKIDFGIEGFEPKLQKLQAGTADAKLEDLLAPRAQAPVLLPAYADLWATTSPAPAATPEPALFLHGPGTLPEVQVVWRADVDPDDDATANLSLALCPPSGLETLPVPVWAVRRWLGQDSEEAMIADVPQTAPETRREKQVRGRPVLRRRAERWDRAWADDVEVARRVTPGDIIVVPSSYGGCDEFGWNPSYQRLVTDCGTRAHYLQRGKGAIRVTLGTIDDALAAEPSEDATTPETVWASINKLTDEASDWDPEALRSGLLEVAGLPATWRVLLKAMAGRRVRSASYNYNNWNAGFVIYAERPLVSGLLKESAEDIPTGAEAVTDREDSSLTGVAVKLSDHLRHVEPKARDFARRAGLDDKLTELVALAGALHDLGKAEPRFQADLRGMSALAWRDPMFASLLTETEGHLLAKSERQIGLRYGPRATPDNFRHEALSVALAAKHLAVETLSEEDRHLVLWLIGTHHGHGRPFFPALEDRTPETEAVVKIDGQMLSAQAREAPLRLDQGWFERSATLHRRFGAWELARLEAILRLADHAASAEEQRRATVPSTAPAEARA